MFWGRSSTAKTTSAKQQSSKQTPPYKARPQQPSSSASAWQTPAPTQVDVDMSTPPPESLEVLQ
eukprot:7002676-Prorocentrum_lima.AAC.1